MEWFVEGLRRAEVYALDHPEDPRSADFLYELHEFKRAFADIESILKDE